MNMPSLSYTEKRILKAKAHNLRPIIIIGDKGLTDAVILETDRALLAHELIKVRINAPDRETRLAYAEKLAKDCDAHLVQVIGHIAVLFRKNEDKNA